jgi:hypothetical protein
MTLADFLQVYPSLNKSDIRHCAAYCASRQCVANEVLNFCQGCTLYDNKSESCLNPECPAVTDDEESSFDDAMEEQPVDGWEYAQELLDSQLHASSDGGNL